MRHSLYDTDMLQFCINTDLLNYNCTAFIQANVLNVQNHPICIQTHAYMTMDMQIQYNIINEITLRYLEIDRDILAVDSALLLTLQY